MDELLSPQLFVIFRQLVEDHTGLHQRQEDIDTFSEKLLGHMREAGFQTPLDYYYRLRYDDPQGEELRALVDALVVGETYFFREVDALRAAVELVLAPAVRTRGFARAWSAACATGEEPLSLAMLLAEAGILAKCEIVATDVSHRALTRARAARYSGRALRALHDNPSLARLAERWLEPEDGAVRVRPELLSAVTYRSGNLVGPPGEREKGSFDLILCRNVLIYFSDGTIERVVARLSDAMRPDGRLLVGASESLLRFGTRLRCEERGGTFFYTRENK